MRKVLFSYRNVRAIFAERDNLLISEGVVRKWRVKEMGRRFWPLVALRTTVVLLLINLFASASWAQEPLRVVLIRGNQFFPMAVMEKQGFDKKNGIEVRQISVVSVEALYSALRSAEADFGFGAWTAIALFRSQGSDLVNVYSMHGFGNDVMVKKDSPLKSIGDLKGKKVGIFGGPASGSTLLFRLVTIKYFGFDPLTDTTIQFGAPPLVRALLAKGEIDAALMLDPLITEMLVSGEFRSIGNIGDIYREKTGTDPMLVAVVTHDSLIKKRPDAVRRFVKAYKESVDYLKAHPEVWPELAKAFGIKSGEGTELLKRRIERTLVTRWDKEFIDQQVKFGEDIGATLGKGFWPGVPAGTFSLEYAPSP